MFFGSICFSRILCSVSRGIELVAIRMSQTWEMPSTFAHCGVSSVMPWMMSTGPRAVVMRENAAAELVEGPDAQGLADAADRLARPQHPLADAEHLFKLAVVFRPHLADQPIGEKGPPQVVVKQSDQLQRGAAVGLGRLR